MSDDIIVGDIRYADMDGAYAGGAVTDSDGNWYVDYTAAREALLSDPTATYSDGTTTYRYSTNADGEQGWHDATGDVQDTTGTW